MPPSYRDSDPAIALRAESFEAMLLKEARDWLESSGSREDGYKIPPPTRALIDRLDQMLKVK